MTSEHDGAEPAAALDPAEVDEQLSALEDAPVEEHVAVYDSVHRRLRDHLSEAPGAH